MVKLLLRSQGMLPIPVPAKFVVVVSGKNCKETGNHSFHLLLTHLHETRDTETIDELACFLLCFPKKQKIRELRYPLDPLISPFCTHGGPVDTPIWTYNSILQFDSLLLVIMSFHGLQEPLHRSKTAPRLYAYAYN